MKILVSDYSGHPFQVQLSRELARRGHRVRHLHFAGFQTPKGNLRLQDTDPESLEIAAVTLDRPFAKRSFIRRRGQEVAVGRLIAAQIADFAPDVVISSNAPLDCQRQIQRAARRLGARFVFWLQDIYSTAIAEVLARKLPLAGCPIAAWYRWSEGRMLRRSDAVVAIAEAFCEPLGTWGVDPARVIVIENWAPLDEIPLLPRDNPWAQARFAPGRLRFVYSGTLGYKHNPHWLLALAEALPQIDVEVFSEGEVAQGLERQARIQGLANLKVRPWTAFAELPAMLAGADVAVAFIEPGAGSYSVPSKILTYLAAGRPVLAAMPPGNLAARLIVENEAGCVVDCDDTEGFLAAARSLAADPALRERQGGNGRAHALRAFAIDHIANRFLAAIAGDRGMEN